MSQVRKHLDPSEHTSMGHMKLIRKGICSTRKVPSTIEEDKPEPHFKPIIEPISNIDDFFVHCFENPLYDDRNKIGVVLPGRTCINTWILIVL